MVEMDRRSVLAAIVGIGSGVALASAELPSSAAAGAAASSLEAWLLAGHGASAALGDVSEKVRTEARVQIAATGGVS